MKMKTIMLLFIIFSMSVFLSLNPNIIYRHIKDDNEKYQINLKKWRASIRFGKNWIAENEKNNNIM